MNLKLERYFYQQGDKLGVWLADAREERGVSNKTNACLVKCFDIKKTNVFPDKCFDIDCYIEGYGNWSFDQVFPGNRRGHNDPVPCPQRGEEQGSRI